MSAAECPDCQEFLDETNRLRAEVEQAERERDEARAQVAVLYQTLGALQFAVSAATINGHIVSCGHDPMCERFTLVLERTNMALLNTPTEARALLDRLQRAEAVVEAAKLIRDDLESNNSEIHNREWWGIEPTHIVELRKALAAWEEGKA